MNRLQRYKVAGHVFGIEMDADSALWQMMGEPYGPFETAEDGLLFCVRLNAAVARPETAVQVYSNEDSVEPGFIALGVWRDECGHYFEFTQPGSDCVNGRLYIDNDFKDASLSLEGDGIRRWLTFNTAVNFCFLLSTACRQTVLTHASCVSYKGKSYLFLGKSGTGKSTHSRMWLSALEGVELLNDDHPVVRVGDDGRVVAYGSPWSGKTRCYKNVEAPVGGIIRISRAPYNKARRLSVIESYGSLMTSCSGMTWEKELADGRDRTIQAIIGKVPCWVMECLPDEDAARVCCEAVSNVI